MWTSKAYCNVHAENFNTVPYPLEVLWIESGSEWIRIRIDPHSVGCTRCKISTFCDFWSLTRIRIRIGLAIWIRIRVETNADPQHCGFKTQISRASCLLCRIFCVILRPFRKLTWSSSAKVDAGVAIVHFEKYHSDCVIQQAWASVLVIFFWLKKFFGALRCKIYWYIFAKVSWHYFWKRSNKNFSQTVR